MLSTSDSMPTAILKKKKSNLPLKEEDLWLLRLQQECATISTRFQMKSSPNAVCFPFYQKTVEDTEERRIVPRTDHFDLVNVNLSPYLLPDFL